VGTVLVLGAGAVGSLFGARLAASGESVLLVGRSAHVGAIRHRGLTVEGVAPGTFRPQASVDIPRDWTGDAVLLTVKSFDLRTAASELARSVRPLPTALLGNGLGIEELARDALRAGGWERPERFLVRVVHTIPATFVGPGTVRASGTGELVVPDPSSAGEGAPSVAAIVALFRRGGFPVRTSADFELEVWRKVVVNAAINPVTARHRVTNGALAEGPVGAEAQLLLEEAVDVARRYGIGLDLATAKADLARVVQATASNRSSMLQDVERGRPTEVEAISGEILRRGRALGMELPATARALDDVRRATGEAAATAQH